MGWDYRIDSLAERAFKPEADTRKFNGLSHLYNAFLYSQPQPALARYGEVQAIYRDSNWSARDYPKPGWYVGRGHKRQDLFAQVGAATSFAPGGAGVRYLFVNGAGDEIMEWFSFASTPDRFEGPWVVR